MHLPYFTCTNQTSLTKLHLPYFTYHTSLTKLHLPYFTYWTYVCGDLGEGHEVRRKLLMSPDGRRSDCPPFVVPGRFTAIVTTFVTKGMSVMVLITTLKLGLSQP